LSITMNPILYPETRVRMLSIFTAPADGQSRTGKDSEHNDCLWMCLIQAFNELPPVLKKPGKLKKWLGLKRDDGIDIELIPKIDIELKMNIIVCGSHQYAGNGKYLRNQKIRLWKGHYEPKDVRGLGNENYNELRSGYDVMKKGRPYPRFYKINLDTDTAKMCYLENYRDGKKIIMEKPMKYLNEFYTKHNPGRRLFLRPVPREKTKQKVDGVEKTSFGYHRVALSFQGVRAIGRRALLGPFHSISFHFIAFQSSKRITSINTSIKG